MQSREELSLTSSTKHNHVLHKQFHAEVQFQIHWAAQLKQKAGGSIIESW